MTPEQGDIVLIPVPFTDLSSHKRRPVIVVSNNSYNRACLDVVVVALTSSAAASPYSFRIDSSDLVAGALNRPSTVRGDKVYTLAQSIVVKKFGRVSSRVVERIQELPQEITAP